MRHRGLAVTIALSIAASFVAACGSDSGSGGTESGGGSRPSESEVQTFVEQYCALVAGCCTELGYSAILDGCHRQLLGSGTPPSSSSLKIAPPGASYDPVSGAACLERLQKPAPSGGSCFPVGPDASDPCWHLFQGHYGTVPPGGTCAADSDCAPAESGASVCAFLAHGGADKQCLWLIPGTVGGGPCIGSTDAKGTTVYGGDAANPKGNICRASDGVYCGVPSEGCKAVAAAGTACTESAECASGICNGDVCVAGSPVGQACGATCVLEAYCDEASRTCVARLSPGAACTADNQCGNERCAAGRCTPLTPIQQMMLTVGCDLSRPPTP